ncbi:MAG: hypothetical protein KGJ09_08770 [Candidatus Omnitrophica bacterium]|nr:hypothetical protein [Candidatus Omnitrophota bacterium]MDE2010152.1 hypothetical protein [Candidatus Omnitrophota bacterium]MDE2214885.1 hypothetical protein [Candidatus Omnitrophota bacterium]MDE2230784.1 hypothetical protein [Candidatus Omnitrophota bacterium]
MSGRRGFISVTVFLFLALPFAVQNSYARPLTAQEIQRVKAVKEILGRVDKESLWQTIDGLEKTRDPRINLEMKEAQARAYADIVRGYGIDTEAKKEWLYSMVCLNMAYLQFGGDEGRPGSTTELNRLIRQKLIKYLPAGTLKQQGFLDSL